MTERRGNQFLLSLLLIVMALISIIFIAVVKLPVERELVYVAMIFVGALSMATISILQKLIFSDHEKTIQVAFDAEHTRESLREIVDLDAIEAEVVKVTREPWESSTNDLISSDPVLAVMKLRLDLEEELRRYAYTHDVHIDPRASHLSALAATLAKQGLLPLQLSAAIQEISKPMNQVVHGLPIDESTIMDIFAAGEDVLSTLRFTTGRYQSERH